MTLRPCPLISTAIIATSPQSAVLWDTGFVIVHPFMRYLLSLTSWTPATPTIHIHLLVFPTKSKKRAEWISLFRCSTGRRGSRILSAERRIWPLIVYFRGRKVARPVHLALLGLPPSKVAYTRSLQNRSCCLSRFPDRSLHTFFQRMLKNRFRNHAKFIMRPRNF